LAYFLTFAEWVGDHGVTVEAFRKFSHRCWPYFTSCGDSYFLSALPQGYSQTALYTVFFAMMVGCAAAMLRRKWALAHALMLPLFVWKFLLVFVFSMSFIANYHYFHLLFSIIFLFARYKLYFLRRLLVVCYVLASTVKIHEGWILGTYFSNIQTGLPGFSDDWIPLATNGVILLEMVGAPFLLSRRYLLQRTVLVSFVLFHLYSGIIVQYHYPTLCLPPLLVLFGPFYRPMQMPKPLEPRAIVGWLPMVLLCLGQSVPFFIRGDVKMTLEGNAYGLYMFEANHQCVLEAELTYPNGETRVERNHIYSARRRCNPYSDWFRFHEMCRRGRVTQVAWKFDHSINGGPFYRIVDEPDACGLTYRAFSHNSWIRLPSEGAAIVGYPVKNVYE
jgi:hypothetical protein